MISKEFQFFVENGTNDALRAALSRPLVPEELEAIERELGLRFGKVRDEKSSVAESD